MILTRTPLRVSLFGGGSDYPEWFLTRGGAVLGMGVKHYQYVGVKRMPPGQGLRYRVQYSKVDDCQERSQIRHPAVRGALEYYEIDEPLEFNVFGDLPGRSGLGGSSAFTVGLSHALRKMFRASYTQSDPWEISDEAICIEQDIVREAVGCQDQVLCAHGGLNFVTFGHGDRFHRSLRRLSIPMSRQEELEYSLVLVFSGGMRDAHEMAAKQIAVLKDRSAVLEQMKCQAVEGAKIIEGCNGLGKIGALLHEAWELKKRITPEITTPAIDELYERGRKLGALGGKLLGAGGGGFMLFFVPPEKRNDFEDRIGHPLENVIISPTGTEVIIGEG